MEYRNIEKLGMRPSLLGFGCMRFPTLAGGGIDEVQAQAMLDRAWEAGVNYYDTAYFYHQGASEHFMNLALAQRARDSYYLVSKLPTTLVHSLEEAKQLYAQQRRRLDRDYLDAYLLHNLDANRWHEMLRWGVVDWCLELQQQGAFRRFGFSFHGSYEDFEEILTARPWDCCQLQLNYMDTEEQAGMRGYALTKTLGVPLIVMEPVKGGSLAQLPDDVTAGFRAARPGASTASWALRWAAGLPNVMTVLSGMSSMEQVEDNLATISSFAPLDERERALVAETARQLSLRVNNGCTKCHYCMPCPAGVDIPEHFSVWNEYGMYSNRETTLRHWGNLSQGSRGKNCTSCGACETRCPQKLNIRADLARAQQVLEGLEA